MKQQYETPILQLEEVDFQIDTLTASTQGTGVNIDFKDMFLTL